MLAPATASCVAFAAFAGIDWLWELAVLPVAFLLLVAAILGPEATSGAASDAERALEPSPPPLLEAVRQPGSASAHGGSRSDCDHLPHASTVLVRNSGEQLRSGELDSALDSAEMAETVEPYAATPKPSRPWCWNDPASSPPQPPPPPTRRAASRQTGAPGFSCHRGQARAPPRPSMHTARRIGSTHGRLCSPRCLRRNSPRASINERRP